MTINVNPDAQVVEMQFEALLRQRIRILVEGFSWQKAVPLG
jgi:hypothetical protein